MCVNAHSQLSLVNQMRFNIPQIQPLKKMRLPSHLKLLLVLISGISAFYRRRIITLIRISN